MIKPKTKVWDRKKEPNKNLSDPNNLISTIAYKTYQLFREKIKKVEKNRIMKDKHKLRFTNNGANHLQNNKKSLQISQKNVWIRRFNKVMFARTRLLLWIVGQIKIIIVIFTHKREKIIPPQTKIKISLDNFLERMRK